MKIIISPSKTQNRDLLIKKKPTGIVNAHLSNTLFKFIQSYSKTELGKLMKIKNNLLEDTYALFQNKEFHLMTKKALNLYQGVAFEQIQSDEYNELDFDYLNKHLIILSAMFGPIKANSYIFPYRLDMTIKPQNINLYQYWDETIDKVFKDEDLIINLASKEFSQMLKNYKEKMITIDFLEENIDGQLKTISYNAKKARGKMVNELVLNKVTQVHDMKSLNIDGYLFNSEKSNNKHFVFIKNRK
ncbi:YaaA family protein [Mycoplasmatota bacterium]|nr:YaaA family protein [Mycoplasmatota bacterium]